MNPLTQIISNLFILILSVTLLNCGGKGSAGYEATKMTLEEQEKSAPTSFLTVEGKTWENFIGETVIEGDINSSAKVARFKDVVLVVNFLSKTDTFLGTQKFTLYEFVDPGKKTHFKLRMTAPDGTQKIDIEIENATPVE